MPIFQSLKPGWSAYFSTGFLLLSVLSSPGNVTWSRMYGPSCRRRPHRRRRRRVSYLVPNLYPQRPLYR